MNSSGRFLVQIGIRSISSLFMTVEKLNDCPTAKVMAEQLVESGKHWSARVYDLKEDKQVFYMNKDALK